MFADKSRSCVLNLLQSVDKVLGTADTWTGAADTWTVMELLAASDQTHCALVVFDLNE